MILQARPNCHVCGKTVHSLHEVYDQAMCRYTLTVRCHGERQVVELTDFEIAALDIRNISLLDAFSPESSVVKHG